MNNNNFKKKLISASIASALLALSGCSTVNFEEARAETESEFDKIKSSYEQGRKMATKTSSVSYMDGFYVSEKPFKLADREILPSFFNEKVVFSSPEPTSFQRLTSLISENIGIRIAITNDASDYLENWASNREESSEDGLNSLDATSASPFGGGSEESEDSEEALPVSLTNMLSNPYGNLSGSNVTFTMNHSGTLSELLDNLTGRVGLFWRWNNNEIEVFRLETKNINIDMDAMAQTFEASIKSQSSFVSGNAEGGGGSGQSGQGMSTTLSYNPGAALTRLKEVIETSMLSADGAVDILEEFGVVTITDVPPKVKKVSEFLEEMNDMATRQIAVKVDVITVTQKDDASAGFDWDAVYNGISGLNASFTGNILEGAGNIQFGVIDTNSAFNGTEGFIDLLGEFADVTAHYSGFVQTTNGSIAPITDTVKQDYIKSISTESGGDDEEGGGDSSTTIKIGEAKTGIDMTVLPQITSKNKVSLSVKYDLSELLDMRDVVTGENLVNLPTSSVKGSYIKAIIDSGKSYMIAGLSNKKAKADQSSIIGDDSPFSWLLGGKKVSNMSEEYSILLITPYVLQD